ncbi:MAG TPA: NIL domain-containing protein [Coleofasciculaceae cyanobacterium]
MADVTPAIATDGQGNPGAGHVESADWAGDRQVRSRVRIRVPSNYRPDPVISTIVSRFGLTVNVLAALLGADRDSDGWFDLELNGSASQVQSALLYFNDLDLEVWQDDDSDGI